MSETPSEEIFGQLRQETSERLSEALMLVSLAQSLENEPPEPDRQEALLLRGLAYVSTYAALEFTVQKAIVIVLQTIASLSPKSNHLSPRIHSIAQDGGFRAIADAAGSKVWGKRVAALDSMFSADVCAMPDTAFSMYLQNVKRSVLEQLFQCLDVQRPVVPEDAYYGYLQEIVDGRNAVSHGRSSAAEQGRRYRSPELIARHAAISEICRHTLDTFETYLSERLFIAPEHRAMY